MKKLLTIVAWIFHILPWVVVGGFLLILITYFVSTAGWWFIICFIGIFVVGGLIAWADDYIDKIRN